MATDIAVATFTYSGSAGTVNFTDASVGFTPTAMIIVGGPATTSEDTETYFAHSIGITDGSASIVYSCASGDNFSTSSTRRVREKGTATNVNVISILDDQNDTEEFQARFSSWQTNGVALNIVDAGVDVTFTCIFFRDLSLHVQSYEITPSTYSIDVADPSFSIVLNNGIGNSASINGHNIYSVGFEKDGSCYCYMWGDEDASANSDVCSALYTPNSASPATDVAGTQQLPGTLYYHFGVSTTASTLVTEDDSDSDYFGIGVFQLNDRQTQVVIVSTPTNTGEDWTFSGLNFEPAGGIIIANNVIENNFNRTNLSYSLSLFDKNHEACYPSFSEGGAATTNTKTKYTNKFIEVYASSGASAVFDLRNPTFQDGGWTISSTDIHALDTVSRSFIGIFWGSAGDVTEGDEVSPNDIGSNTSFDVATFLQSHIFSTNEIASQSSIDSTSFSITQSISPNDLTINTTIDGTTYNVTYTFSPNDVASNTSIDATTFTQDHVISTDELASITSLDSTTFSQTHILHIGELSSPTSIDTTSFSQEHILSTNELGSSTSIDSTSLSQEHVLVTAELASPTAIDATSFSQNHIVSTNELSITTTIDNTTFSLTAYLTPADLSINTSVDTTSFSIDTITISTNDLAVISGIDAGSFTQEHIVSVGDIEGIVSIDSTSFAEGVILNTFDLAVIASVDNSSFIQNHVITTAELAVTTSIDGTAFTAGQSLSAADLAITVEVENSSFSQEHILVTDEFDSITSIDGSSFIQDQIVDTNELTISSEVESASFGQGVIVNPDDMAISTAIDVTSWVINFIVSPLGLNISVSSGVTSYSQDHILSVYDEAISVIVDETNSTFLPDSDLRRKVINVRRVVVTLET